MSIEEKVKVIYDEEEFIVVFKPSGLLYHRSFISKDRLFLLQTVRNLNGGNHVYPVHRLDRATSGVTILAKNKEFANKLSILFKERKIHKEYIAFVNGITDEEEIIELPLTNKTTKEQMECLSKFKRIGFGENFSLIIISPITGKRHQLRRHLKKIHHHIIGDTTYGKGEKNRYWREKIGLFRLGLHAFKLEFNHPDSGEKLIFKSPLEDNFAGPLLKIEELKKILTSENGYI